MSIKKNFFYNAILSVSQLILPMITFPYVTRILLPKGLGDVNFVDSIVQYITVVAALGIPLYGTREVAKSKNSPEKLQRVFNELFILHVLLSVSLSILFLVSALYIGPLKENFNLCMIGSGIILSNSFVITWLYSGLEEFGYITKVNLVIRILTVLMIFILIKTPADKNLYYAISLGNLILTAVINLNYAKRFVVLKLNNLALRKHFKPLFMLFSLSIFTNAYVLLDSVILGFLKNTIEVGYYTVSMRISKLPVSLISSLTVVLIPALSSIGATNQRTTSIINSSLSFTILFCVPVSLGLFTLSPELVQVFAGTGFSPSVPSLRILSFIIIPIGIALVCYQILLPLNKERLMMSTAIVGLCASLGLNFLLIPFFKSVGSASASLITEIIVALLLVYYSKSVTKIFVPYKTFAHALITSLSFIAVHRAIQNITDTSVIIIVLTVITCSALYFLIMIFIFKNEFMKNSIDHIFRKVLGIWKISS
ncbi:flippase [Kaistella daneshvariae]|uniref:Flippase n=1 Tax=Kaistella daneshvariae TaxID=2487074 RepID=A0ABN5SZW3_9FLAO|nr:flippase [Kaistella daneshvariae]AZI66585.1 flippase [Kaistella daneshvariae]